MVKYCRELVTFFVTGSSGQWILALLRRWSNNYTCKKKYQKRETVKLWCWYVHMIMATGTYLVNAPSQVLRKGILIFYIQKRYCVVRNPLSWHFFCQKDTPQTLLKKTFQFICSYDNVCHYRSAAFNNLLEIFSPLEKNLPLEKLAQL